MKYSALLFLCVTSLGWAQREPAPVNKEASVTNVPFERILRANQ